MIVEGKFLAQLLFQSRPYKKIAHDFDNGYRNHSQGMSHTIAQLRKKSLIMTFPSQNN